MPERVAVSDMEEDRVIVQQVFVKGIAHSSYLIGGGKTCAIVDPRRDTGIYLDAARAVPLVS